LGFWVLTNTTHAITPWFQGIAQQPSSYSEAHCKDTNFGNSNFFLEIFLESKITAFQSKISGTCSEENSPNGLQQAPWDVFDRLLANKPELDCLSSHFFE
jgi:hypothetical protein